MSEHKLKLVISAVNFSEGGPLTVLRECLKAATQTLSEDWKIIALVHDKRLFDASSGVVFLEFPLSKKSWLLRLFYEWFYFYKLSKQIKPDLWLSLHDITPRVIARRRAVYCHNPSPFFNVTFRDALLDPKLFLFNRLYKYLYGCGIIKNRFVIVQQSWLRNEFRHAFGLNEVVVAYPELDIRRISRQPTHLTTRRKVFFYPALPRVPKNIEVIFEASRLLHERGIGEFEVRLTIDGTENRYAQKLVKQYSNVPNVLMIGRQDQSQMAEEYRNCDCLLFPSRLETWGLPISEAKAYGLPMLVADLPYAYETVGTYNLARFFDPLDPEALAELMQDFVGGELQFQETRMELPHQPFVENWPLLMGLLTEGLDTDAQMNASSRKNDGQAMG